MNKITWFTLHVHFSLSIICWLVCVWAYSHLMGEQEATVCGYERATIAHTHPVSNTEHTEDPMQTIYCHIPRSQFLLQCSRFCSNSLSKCFVTLCVCVWLFLAAVTDQIEWQLVWVEGVCSQEWVCVGTLLAGSEDHSGPNKGLEQLHLGKKKVLQT